MIRRVRDAIATVRGVNKQRSRELRGVIELLRPYWLRTALMFVALLLACPVL